MLAESAWHVIYNDIYLWDFNKPEGEWVIPIMSRTNYVHASLQYNASREIFILETFSC